MASDTASQNRSLFRERLALVHRLDNWLETPMVVLGFVWLALLVVDLLGHASRTLVAVTNGIWALFVLDFGLKLTLAPNKPRYLRKNWLTVISLLLPALRVIRIVRVVRLLRAARAARGLRLVRVLGSLNRGMRALGATMGRRGFGYVAALTGVITLAGAAGMYSFESAAPGERGLRSFWDALWWTGMLMTTMGSEYWPKSGEGRVLCVLLSLYAFAVFGYVTATLATFFIGRDAANPEAELPSAEALKSLQGELSTVREEIRALRAELATPDRPLESRRAA
jgi:voltage-gated potassium channel